LTGYYCEEKEMTLTTLVPAAIAAGSRLENGQMTIYNIYPDCKKAENSKRQKIAKKAGRPKNNNYVVIM